MIQKLSKHGDSLALVIDRSILDLLRIDESTPLEISTDGRALLIAPVRANENRQKLEQAMAVVNQRFAETFKRLAE